MAAFRARSDSASSFDLETQASGSSAYFGDYARASDLVARSDAILTPAPHALIDTVPGDTSTTAVLTVGAAPTISAIDTIADNDFYQITLVAGHEYEIGMYGYTPTNPGDPLGPTGVPLADSFIELYDSTGQLITSADGGADTMFNSANSGFDALLSFTATTSGTYYVDARAFDNISADGDRGDLVGDYGLYAKDVTDDPSIYRPYYSPDSPLYAIDWGTRVNKVNQTAANPDGNEGPRQTGNAQGTPVHGAGLDMDAILAANGKTEADIAGKNVVTIYFAHAGEVITSIDNPTSPGLPPAAIETSDVSDFEHKAVMTALHEFEKVADVVYLEVQDNSQADFEYASYKGTPGPGISLLGSMEPPDEPNEGLALFNSGDERWNATDLQQGGFSFTTLIHEFGHGNGLAHPHDNGGHSGIMHGVQPEGAGVADYTTGDFDLNQAVFTMMSYEDGWQDSPYGNAPTTGGYGYLGSLMALDIAAIQDKYGVNEDTATGNDLYVLKDVNAPGTYFTSIWDAGGNDRIIYYGARDAHIDLRPATLQYEWGGGGWVSYANGIFGGFTIANGVTIENATGGSGNDTLIGNDAANVLIGNAGNDTLDGDLGGDVLAGGDGDDTLIGGTGTANELIGGTGNDLYYVSVQGDTVYEAAGEGTDTVRTALSNYTLSANVENLIFTGTGDFVGVGNDGNNFILGGSGNDIIAGGLGSDSLAGGDGNDILIGDTGAANELIGGTGDDLYIVSDRGDTVYEVAGEGNDTIETSLSIYVMTAANVEKLTGTSNAGQILIGSDGNDRITGGTGNDELHGGLGNDTYVVLNAGDTIIEDTNGGTDTVETNLNYYQLSAANVENLTYTGTGSFYGSGDDGNNVITGGAGNDTLRGGLGNDTLSGGAGNDFYLFDTAPSAGNADIVAGFVSGSDRILLDNTAFTALSEGGLTPSAFVAGTAAQDADDRIIYDQTTGNLYYDADGNGAGAAILFATLQGHPALGASDFSVI
jgi:serralysin